MSAGVSPQILYGRREDAMEIWRQRDPSSPHRRYELAARTVIDCDRELAAWFEQDAEQVEFELAQYREREQTGE